MVLRKPRTVRPQSRGYYCPFWSPPLTTHRASKLRANGPRLVDARNRHELEEDVMGSTNKIKGYGHSAPGLSAAATICAVVPFIVLRVVRRGGVGEVCIMNS